MKKLFIPVIFFLAAFSANAQTTEIEKIHSAELHCMEIEITNRKPVYESECPSAGSGSSHR